MIRGFRRAAALLLAVGVTLSLAIVSGCSDPGSAAGGAGTAIVPDVGRNAATTAAGDGARRGRYIVVMQLATVLTPEDT
jgi:hypothetical protein